MKTLKHFSIVLAGLLLFIACQKELSFETGNKFGGLAEGTILRDSTGNCLPISVNGTYKSDSTLSDSNYISLQINMTSAGTYKIFTDTQNGFSFQDSGYTGTTGLQTIKLKATGRPILPIPTNFTVAFGTSFCSFTVNVTASSGGGGTTPAAFTLSGAPGTCTGASAVGTYRVGTALNSTNKVTITVNVTTAGTYTVNTALVNNMAFGFAGSFTTTGVQTVTLQGVGSPAAAGTTTFPITAGGTTCSFTVTVTPATGPPAPTAADSAWSFNQGAKFFHGTIDTAYTEVIPSLGTALTIFGTNYPTHDTAWQIDVLLPGSTVVVGTYNTSTNADFFYYDSSLNDIYVAEPTKPTVNVAITITAYDAATKTVTGTFTGTALNAAGAIVPITNGKFKGRLQ